MTKKARFIDKLTSLNVDEKEKVKTFFTKYPVYENRIDWNCKTLSFSDFEKIFIKAEASGKAIKRKAKNNPEVLFEGYNCRIVHKADNFLIVMPLDWECAVFFNSFNCGGLGAKWCIGNKYSGNHWNDYVSQGNAFYLIYFIGKHYIGCKKALVQYDEKSDEFLIWDIKVVYFSILLSKKVYEKLVYYDTIFYGFR